MTINLEERYAIAPSEEATDLGSDEAARVSFTLVHSTISSAQIIAVLNLLDTASHRRRKHQLETTSTPFDLKAYNSTVTQIDKISTRFNENIAGSSLSPRYFLLHNRMGNSTHSFKCNLRRHNQLATSNSIYLIAGSRSSYYGRGSPSSEEISAGYQRDYRLSVISRLLCGAARGEISIVDLERPFPTDSRSRVEHIVTPCGAACLHKSLITYCQWYPQDTSTFISSDRVGKEEHDRPKQGVQSLMERRHNHLLCLLILWDANKSEVVDEYFFDNEITEMHWSNAFIRNPLIAVANLTSNVTLIDPRSGDSSQNLRWPDERVSSVRWSLENGNILTTGCVRGNIVVWDVRSSRSNLMTVTPSSRFSYHRKDSGAQCITGLRFSKDGLYLVSLSLSHTFTVWRAHTMEIINHVSLPREYTTKIASSIRFDIFSDDGILRTCMPMGDEVLILTLDKKNHENFRVLLMGHFQRVIACIYRQKYNQVISSGNDRMIHVWSPDMDEQLPDQQLEKVFRLQEDQWSDEEGPSHI
ncbi:DNA excision repair protein ERCC-8 [Dirofilaria immitis]|nr:DNA excision repair protein ERCC-8 [Dirofilaria immitis]